MKQLSIYISTYTIVLNTLYEVFNELAAQNNNQQIIDNLDLTIQLFKKVKK